MDKSSFIIRHMSEDEVPLAVDWAAAEGWNPGLHDAQCFWAADQQGFLVGIKDGQPVGCISAVRYNADYGFIGFYILRPEWRGQGYGLQMWRRAMEQLAGRTVGLDGVLAQQENYRKSGFQLAYRNIRYSGRFSGITSDRAAESGPGLSTVLASMVNGAELAAYDSNLFSTARPAFLSGWLSQPAATASAVIAGDRLMGYGVIRQCRNGFKIGPLFAEDTAAAEKLLLSLAACAKGEEVFLDVPEVNTAAVVLAAKYNMAKVFETARMYKGPAPSVALEKIFGVTTFELG